jgi:hypothetical protein
MKILLQACLRIGRCCCCNWPLLLLQLQPVSGCMSCVLWQQGRAWRVEPWAVVGATLELGCALQLGGGGGSVKFFRDARP